MFVTQNRRKKLKTLTPELLEYLRQAFGDCPQAWRCKLIEFGGREDHVHLLGDIHPAVDISVLYLCCPDEQAQDCQCLQCLQCLLCLLCL